MAAGPFQQVRRKTVRMMEFTAWPAKTQPHANLNKLDDPFPDSPTREVGTMPAGRPTEYDPAYCERAVELGREGKSKAQIAAELGHSRQSLDNWIEQHQEFMDAMKKANDLALCWWEDQGQKGLGADKFNATAFIFQMKNRFRSDYNDKSEVEHSGNVGIREWLTEAS